MNTVDLLGLSIKYREDICHNIPKKIISVAGLFLLNLIDNSDKYSSVMIIDSNVRYIISKTRSFMIAVSQEDEYIRVYRLEDSILSYSDIPETKAHIKSFVDGLID